MAQKWNHLAGQPQTWFVTGGVGYERGKVVNYISVKLREGGGKKKEREKIARFSFYN